MAEDRYEPPEWNERKRRPWMELFRGFQIALDFNKLLLAAMGILIMAFGWWLLAIIFEAKKPVFAPKGPTREERVAEWREHKSDLERWKIRQSAAGSADTEAVVDEADVADELAEYEQLRALREVTDAKRIEAAAKALYPDGTPDAEKRRRELVADHQLVQQKLTYPSGRLRTWPWYEDRGPNQYLLITGQTPEPWGAGRFADWLLTKQVPVLLEPLVKLLSPVIYLLKAKIGFVNALYFFLVMIWTIVTWVIFGGAIARIAAMQIARQEKITLGESLKFVSRRLFSYVTAPLFPLVFLAFMTIGAMIFGAFHVIPGFGEIFDTLFWPLMLILGLVMTIAVIGLIGWPLMPVTISADGTDSWEAVSRSYSYVFQAPWQFAWYSVIAIAYGAVIVFFVGLAGSMTVYLSKWSVSKSPLVAAFPQRDPSFLFVYSPTTYQWRELMLSEVQLDDGTYLVDPNTGKVDQANYDKFLGRTESYDKDDRLHGFNRFGAAMVFCWLCFMLLLILGFGYSYFWSAVTIIYFLLRQKVDAAEIDEVYLEDEEFDAYPSTVPPPPAGDPAQPPSGQHTLPLVEGGAPPVATAQPDAPAPETAPPTATPAEEPPQTSAEPPPTHDPQPASEPPRKPAGEGESIEPPSSTEEPEERKDAESQDEGDLRD